MEALKDFLYQSFELKIHGTPQNIKAFSSLKGKHRLKDIPLELTIRGEGPLTQTLQTILNFQKYLSGNE